ncbi:MAG: hypothetical protein KY445_15125, partial [Armatimonadetes bacterium]|nr:hypothetical protein [Armatimonadota bacterium]
IARGAAARDLAQRLLDRSDEQLVALRGAISASDSIVGVCGAFDDLPWATEALYLGRDGAPSLLWPVHLAPPWAPDLMERALRRRFPALAAPLTVVPAWKIVLPLGEALPLRRDRIEQFLARDDAP